MKATKEYRLSMTDEAQKIVDQLTLEQKVSLMSGSIIDLNKVTPEQIAAMMGDMQSDENHYNMVPYPAGGLEEHNIPPMLFVDGPRGVVCGTGKTTCFPVSMARGATFSPELEEKVGNCIGREVRAFGGNLFAGVCINMPYNPGWGRSQETYGEETFQIGKMGAALVKGVQDEDVMACVKHYAFNDMENARFKCSVTCDQRTEQEVYLPHFKDCIDAGAASIMSAYNRYNGVHCGHNKYLLSQVLKDEWDFDGFVMSDFCWGVLDTVEAANGGQDMEMMWTQYFGERLVKAVRDGFVPEERVNDAALRIVRTILAFDKDHKEFDMSVVGCPEHIAVAKEVAEKAITLIKNDNVLPLKRENTKKIALIGKLANTAIIGDHGSSWVRPPYVVTPEEGLKKANENCEVVYDDGSDIARAKALAAESDAVIFVVGYNYDDEGEFVSQDQSSNYTGAMGGDRKESLGLHADEIELIKQVGPVNEKSTAVLVGGNMIMMTEWYDCVNAVIMAYYPGMEGGTALAEIIYGDVNPSGKLPYVVPYSEDDLPHVDWEATDQYYEYYHGYTRLEKNGVKPMIPYGFGLSYTTFAITDPQVRKDGEQLTVTAKVKNTGTMDGDEVVQVYVGFKNSAVDRPVKQLRGFRRVSVKAGEEKEVVITIPFEKLKWYNPVYREWQLENMEYPIYVGSSAAEENLVKTAIRL
ncbi:MAG: glycoside hydrolase family 3 C-terminal domain-containing protein [Clostridiales bacterium]|nr:glycoside hydrolase family 3 C-terminal domain-containing protein [Roseburia sp.]MDD7636737.1 glycoside hydrolase family 3 C-terminal domain-containing protein [Clostridiales bacterium]MDY4113858.1 glycoside hydrolase family 3 C-terminal domain-containing protein [Roseburia sp.]